MDTEMCDWRILDINKILAIPDYSGSTISFNLYGGRLPYDPMGMFGHIDFPLKFALDVNLKNGASEFYDIYYKGNGKTGEHRLEIMPKDSILQREFNWLLRRGIPRRDYSLIDVDGDTKVDSIEQFLYSLTRKDITDNEELKNLFRTADIRIQDFRRRFDVDKRIEEALERNPRLRQPYEKVLLTPSFQKTF